MAVIRTVSVVGLGLIGGSIAAALSPRYTVFGTDVDRDAVDFCINQHIIAGDAKEHWQESDIVLVATPVDAVSAAINEIFSIVGDRAIIGDVASVKSSIVSQLPEGIRYVGLHPMAGKEKGGVRNYSPALLQNAVVVLTGTTETKEDDLTAVARVIADLDALAVRADAASHDAAVSKISHLPHMIAYTLSRVALGDPLAMQLAAGSFRDMTRVAASDPDFWTSVAFFNKTNLLKDMRAFNREFSQLLLSIDEGNGAAAKEQMKEGKRLHDEMASRSIGSRDALFVALEDKPLALAAVTTILGSEGVNIIGLQILNSREGLGGELKLEFSSKDDCAKAKKVLSARGYAAER